MSSQLPPLLESTANRVVGDTKILLLSILSSDDMSRLTSATLDGHDRPVVAEPEPRGETVGARLRRLRLEQGLSQRDLSSPGITYAYISRIEAGARTPSVKALRMLARKLGVSPEYLETGSELDASELRELRLAEQELRLRLDGRSRSRGGLRAARGRRGTCRRGGGDARADRARARGGGAGRPRRGRSSTWRRSSAPSSSPRPRGPTCTRRSDAHMRPRAPPARRSDSSSRRSSELGRSRAGERRRPRPLQHLSELRADRPRRAPASSGCRCRAVGRRRRGRLLHAGAAPLVARPALARAGEADRSARQLPARGGAARGDGGHASPRPRRTSRAPMRRSPPADDLDGALRHLEPAEQLLGPHPGDDDLAAVRRMQAMCATRARATSAAARALAERGASGSPRSSRTSAATRGGARRGPRPRRRRRGRRRLRRGARAPLRARHGPRACRGPALVRPVPARGRPRSRRHSTSSSARPRSRRTSSASGGARPVGSAVGPVSPASPISGRAARPICGRTVTKLVQTRATAATRIGSEGGGMRPHPRVGVRWDAGRFPLVATRAAGRSPDGGYSRAVISAELRPRGPVLAAALGASRQRRDAERAGRGRSRRRWPRRTAARAGTRLAAAGRRSSASRPRARKGSTACGSCSGSTTTTRSS